MRWLIAIVAVLLVALVIQSGLLAYAAYVLLGVLLLTRLLGVDPLAASIDWIGMSVQPKFLRNSKLKPTDVYFVPKE